MTAEGILYVTEHIRDVIADEIPQEFKPWSLEPSYSAWNVNVEQHRPSHDSIPIVSTSDQFNHPTQIGCVEVWLEEQIGQSQMGDSYVQKRLEKYDVQLWSEEEFVVPNQEP